MASPFSGQITVTTAGTAVQGPDIPGYGFFIRALSTNTGVVYLGNDGADDVTSANGFELSPGDLMFIEIPPTLENIWFDAAEDGDKFCWFCIERYT
jgi:hypothetical protein